MSPIDDIKNNPETDQPTCFGNVTPPRIAFVTMVPVMYSILTNADDPEAAYALKKNTVEIRTVSKFYEKNSRIKELAEEIFRKENSDLDAVNELEIDVIFAPAITGEWSIFDDHCRAGLIRTLKRKNYTHIINLCEATALYRLAHTNVDNLQESETTLKSLQCLALTYKYVDDCFLMPGFNNLKYGEYSWRVGRNTDNYVVDYITDLEVKEKLPTTSNIAEASKTYLSPIWNINLAEKLKNAPTDRESARDKINELLESTGMHPLKNQMIYIDYQEDFYQHIKDITTLGTRVEGYENNPLLLSEIDDLSVIQSIKDKYGEQPNIRTLISDFKAACKTPSELNARELKLSSVKDAYKRLNDENISESERSLYQAAVEIASSRSPVTLAFHDFHEKEVQIANLKGTDGQPYLNDKINAWYICNSLAHGLLSHDDLEVPVAIWAKPALLTNGVKFTPTMVAYTNAIERALLSGIARIANAHSINLSSEQKIANKSQFQVALQP